MEPDAAAARRGGTPKIWPEPASQSSDLGGNPFHRLRLTLRSRLSVLAQGQGPDDLGAAAPASVCPALVRCSLSHVHVPDGGNGPSRGQVGRWKPFFLGGRKGTCKRWYACCRCWSLWGIVGLFPKLVSRCCGGGQVGPTLAPVSTNLGPTYALPMAVAWVACGFVSLPLLTMVAATRRGSGIAFGPRRPFAPPRWGRPRLPDDGKKLWRRLRPRGQTSQRPPYRDSGGTHTRNRVRAKLLTHRRVVNATEMKEDQGRPSLSSGTYAPILVQIRAL